jgi:hypothetical protein
LQTLCYREEIEASLRTPGQGGFSLLGLNDFPGQGTALVGVLDVFWEEKGYVTPEQWRRFCGPTVLLARMPSRVCLAGQRMAVHIELSHFGPEDIRAAAVWQLVDDTDTVAAEGTCAPQSCATGDLYSLGEISLALPDTERAVPYRLIVRLPEQGIENDWPIWVYPDRTPAEPPSGVLLSHRLGDVEWLHLQRGGTLVLSPEPSSVPTPAQIGFTGVYWNTAWTINQPPHTLGLCCDPAHPALRGFPNEGHTDWQWWDVLHHSAAMRIDELPRELEPVVQVVDDWNHNRRLALVFEAQAAGGRLLVCSADLRHDLEHRPATRQLRESLLAYAASEAFSPSVEVTPQAIKRIIGSN